MENIQIILQPSHRNKGFHIIHKPVLKVDVNHTRVLKGVNNNAHVPEIIR